MHSLSDVDACHRTQDDFWLSFVHVEAEHRGDFPGFLGISKLKIPDFRGVLLKIFEFSRNIPKRCLCILESWKGKSLTPGISRTFVRLETERILCASRN